MLLPVLTAHHDTCSWALKFGNGTFPIHHVELLQANFEHDGMSSLCVTHCVLTLRTQVRVSVPLRDGVPEITPAVTHPLEMFAFGQSYWHSPVRLPSM
ncbi:hypothetical protein TW71_024725 (plasmid) [Vibrio coralliilyticus]|uniref:hypothetical protein n=1 Tax=Vibrio coralliilyticus TaxID=190893 RepID=UPI0012D3D77B|nr:hypothetical protein [Vibrio coralliilyticus]QOU33189.1 hypothetical protein TW71_024725 [Vibrio coralliilyticus]